MASRSYQRRQARGALEYWFPKGLDTLRKAYPSRYSNAKELAWEHCKSVCAEHTGYCLRVLSHNGWMFTAGFKYVAEDGQEMFYYITPTYEVAIAVEEEN